MGQTLLKKIVQEHSVIVSPTEPSDNIGKVWIKCGNNIYNEKTMLELTGQYRAGNSGNIITSETNKGLKVPTEPNSTYIITQTGTTSNYHEICFFDSEFNYLSGVAESLTEINTPENCYIMTIQTNINATDIMINKGSTALPYEEYIEKELYVKNDNDIFEKFYSEAEVDKKITENIHATTIYNSLSQINKTLNWDTCTTDNIFANMVDNSIAFLGFETAPAVVTELGFNEGAGGELVFYKTTAWRGMAHASEYYNNNFKIAYVAGKNNLAWKSLTTS